MIPGDKVPKMTTVILIETESCTR